MAKHSCEKVLELAKKEGLVKSDFTCQDGDLWQCSCGKVYVHVCDEAEGCCWTETHSCEEGSDAHRSTRSH